MNEVELIEYIYKRNEERNKNCLFFCTAKSEIKNRKTQENIITLQVNQACSTTAIYKPYLKKRPSTSQHGIIIET